MGKDVLREVGEGGMKMRAEEETGFDSGQAGVR